MAKSKKDALRWFRVPGRDELPEGFTHRMADTKAIGDCG